MPRATRNTNTNSGNEVSAPPKLNTLSKNSALTPSVAANDSTTVAMSITGATSARSSRARMTNTTSRTIGMIRFRSCADARCTSRLTAVLPPTIALAPGMACTASRVRSIVAYAAWLSGAAVSVASRYAWPPMVTGCVTPVRPLTDRSVAASCGVAAESLSVGQPVGVQSHQPEGHRAEHQGGGDPHDPRPHRDVAADARP